MESYVRIFQVVVVGKLGKNFHIETKFYSPFSQLRAIGGSKLIIEKELLYKTIYFKLNFLNRYLKHGK